MVQLHEGKGFWEAAYAISPLLGVPLVSLSNLSRTSLPDKISRRASHSGGLGFAGSSGVSSFLGASDSLGSLPVLMFSCFQVYVFCCLME